MENLIVSQIKHWWISLLLGILFVIMGIWVVLTPIASYVTLSIFFSAVIFASGIFGIIFSIANKDRIRGWAWHLIGSILDLVIGTILLIYPALSMVVLPFVVGFWFMFTGFSVIGISGEFKSMGWKSSGWGIAFGILTILFALLLIINPLIGAATIVYMTAMAFFTLGFFKIYMAFQLKKLNRMIE